MFISVTGKSHSYSIWQGLWVFYFLQFCNPQQFSHRFLIVITTGVYVPAFLNPCLHYIGQSYSGITNEHLYSFHAGSFIEPGIYVYILSPHFLSGKYTWGAEEEYFLKPLPMNECQCYIILRSLLQLLAE